MEPLKIDGRTPKSLEDWAESDNIENIYSMWRPVAEGRDVQSPIRDAWTILWQARTDKPKKLFRNVDLKLGAHLRELHNGQDYARNRFRSAIIAFANSSRNDRPISLGDAGKGPNTPDLELYAMVKGEKHREKHLAVLIECKLAKLGKTDTGSVAPAKPSAIRVKYLSGIAQLMTYGGQAWEPCGTALTALYVNNCFWRMLIVPSTSIGQSQESQPINDGNDVELPSFLVEVAADSGLAGVLITPKMLLDDSLKLAAIPPNKFPELVEDQQPPPVSPDSALGRQYELMVNGGLLAERYLASEPGQCIGGPRPGDKLLPTFTHTLLSITQGNIVDVLKNVESPSRLASNSSQQSASGEGSSRRGNKRKSDSSAPSAPARPSDPSKPAAASIRSHLSTSSSQGRNKKKSGAGEADAKADTDFTATASASQRTRSSHAPTSPSEGDDATHNSSGPARGSTQDGDGDASKTSGGSGCDGNDEPGGASGSGRGDGNDGASGPDGNDADGSAGESGSGGTRAGGGTSAGGDAHSDEAGGFDAADEIDTGPGGHSGQARDEGGMTSNHPTDETGQHGTSRTPGYQGLDATGMDFERKKAMALQTHKYPRPSAPQEGSVFSPSSTSGSWIDVTGAHLGKPQSKAEVSRRDRGSATSSRDDSAIGGVLSAATGPVALTAGNLARLERALADEAARKAVQGILAAAHLKAGIETGDEAASVTTSDSADSDAATGVRTRLAALESMGCKILFVDSASMDSIYQSLRRDLVG